MAILYVNLLLSRSDEIVNLASSSDCFFKVSDLRSLS